MYLVVLPNQPRRIFLASNCIVMPCSVPVNCPAVICLPFMPCYLFKESTSSELWTPVQSLSLIHLPLLLVYLLQSITFNTICLILCYSKPVSLTTSLIRWGKVLSLCCAGFHVACNTCVTFPSSYWFHNLGFLLRENLLLCCITPFSWGFPTKHCTLTQCHQALSGVVAVEAKDVFTRRVLINLSIFFVFSLLSFLCSVFFASINQKIQKKLV